MALKLTCDNENQDNKYVVHTKMHYHCFDEVRVKWCKISAHVIHFQHSVKLQKRSGSLLKILHRHSSFCNRFIRPCFKLYIQHHMATGGRRKWQLQKLKLLKYLATVSITFQKLHFDGTIIPLGGRGWFQRGLEPSLCDHPSWEIWLRWKRNMADFRER